MHTFFPIPAHKEEIALSTLGLDDAPTATSKAKQYGAMKRYTSILVINGCVAVFFAFATKRFIQHGKGRGV